MVSSYTRDFSVTWDNPADAELTWINDRMHLPHPLCQAMGEYWNRIFSKYMGMRTVSVNGYGYSTAPTPLPPSQEILARGVVDVWNNDYLPRIEEICARLRSADYEAMPLAELGSAIDGIMGDAVTGFGYTMRPVTGFMGPTFGLVMFLQDELGPDGPQLGATLLQGFENGTAAAGAGLSALAEDAASRPAVADAFRRGDLDGLESVEGGAEFMARFRSYLDEFGWRVDSWGLIEKPTWAENPRVPLTLIGHYIADPTRSPDASHRRSVEQREQAVREVEARLSAEKLDAFRPMLAASQAHVPISEGRALWQLITVGSLRVPLLALGHKLASAGALDHANQVFFFNTAELKAASQSPTPQVRATAQTREAEFAEFQSMTPPPFIGAPPDIAAMPPEAVPMLTLFFGLASPEVEGKQIKGRAASKGVVKGTARVILDLSEADRLQAGEILVCTTTAPPWTPLFAIAGAVVTDTGGVLSHSAICAREYAIPCVVATQVATAMIPDGATIIVDGTKGTVQIVG